MAVATATPLLKSHPDVSKLNTFTGYVVQVTKHLGPKGTPGTSVVPTQRMTKDALFALQTMLPVQHGAGYYMFDVTDEGGTGADSWMVKLGADVPGATQEAFPMAGPMITPPGASPTGAPLDPSVQQIMPGWFFNETLGLLTTPWRETVQWRQGDPLPKPPSTAGHLSVVPPNATPWNWQGQAGGWGGYPATNTDSDKQIAALEARLAEERRERAEAERRREERDREDRAREEAKRDREAAEARFEKLLLTLTAKPAGPTPAEIEAQRRADELEHRLNEERREAQRKEEEQRREDRINAQIAEQRRETERLIREMSSNRADPMLTLLTTVMQTQATASTETIRTIRDASAQATAAAERGATQVLELARASRDGAVDSSKTVMEAMKGAMDMQSQVYSQLLDVAGQGNQPWWAGVVQEGVGKIGLIGQALAERNQQQQQQQQAMQLPQRRAPQPMPMAPQAGQPAARMAPGPTAAAPLPPAPSGPAPVASRPADADYDNETDEFVFPDGWRVSAADVQRVGWAAVLRKRRAPAPVQATNGITVTPPIPAPSTNGVVHEIPIEAVDPVVVAVPSAKPRKAKRARKARHEAMPTEAAPPVQQVSTLEGLRETAPKDALEAIEPLDDQMLFGALMPYVTDLRAKVSSGRLPEEKAAEFVLGTRAYANSFGAAPPPAFELLAAGQIAVLIERLLPDASEEYKDGVVQIMEERLEAENGGAAVAEQ
jgi:hypothetical protein